jgi:hypothetical protein
MIRPPIPLVGYLDGEEFGRYTSTAEAGRRLKIGTTNITSQLKGRVPFAGGMTFKYESEVEDDVAK